MRQEETPVRRSDLFEYRKRLGARELLVVRDDGKPNGILSQQYSAALKAFADRKSHDQMLVLSEDMGFVLTALLRLFGWRGRLSIIVHAGHIPRRGVYFRLLDSQIVKNYVVYCERQRQALIQRGGVSPEKVHTLMNPVDTVFFDPDLVESRGPDSNYVFACGLENRDYNTLSEAAALTDAQFVIQATGYFVEETDGLEKPNNIDVRKARVSFERLREMYNDAAFVVVPLNPVDYAAGVNGILEAMAMGKAVVAMQSPGLEEYIEVGGVRVVPPGDAQALADAIDELKADPDLCRHMGRINRDWVVKNCEVSDYADKVAHLMQ